MNTLPGRPNDDAKLAISYAEYLRNELLGEPNQPCKALDGKTLEEKLNLLEQAVREAGESYAGPIENLPEKLTGHMRSIRKSISKGDMKSAAEVCGDLSALLKDALQMYKDGDGLWVR